MNTIEIMTDAQNESVAVANGKAICESSLPIRIGEGVWSLTEDQFSELEQYLARRGIEFIHQDDDMIARQVAGLRSKG